MLCHYGFVVRGLQRLQIETLSDNTAVLRSSAWGMGEFLDEVLLGLLAQDWKGCRVRREGDVPGGVRPQRPAKSG